MARRHIQVAQSFQAQLVQRLASMSPMELSMADLARWFDVSTRIEREARGLARMEAPVPCPQHGESATGEMVRRILADAEASQLALDILDRIAGRHEPACPRPTESEL